MRCIKCGLQLTNKRFCPSCGTDNEKELALSSQKYPVPENICCPDCGSRELLLCAEDDSEAHDGKNAAGRSRSIHRFLRPLLQLLRIDASSSEIPVNNWICTECGHEFRNPTELKDEIDSAKAKIKRIPSIITISSFCLILLSILLQWFLVAGITFGLFFVSMFFFFRCLPTVSAGTQQKEDSYYKLRSDMRKFLS